MIAPWLWLRTAWETGLTVGEVAGIMGGILSILSSLIPLLSAVVVVGLIQRQKEKKATAATWTTVAVTIQASLWTTFAGLTSGSPRGMRSSIYVVGVLGFLAGFTGPIASFLTAKPLGGVIKASPRSHTVDFIYAKDESYYGLGTLDPPEQIATRTCGWSAYIDCPGSSWNNDQDKDSKGQLVVNASIPENILQPFIAGTASTTLSSPLDIAYRNWYIRNTSYVDGGAPLPVGQRRALDNIILGGGFRIVEGLIINSDDGGICFRKHSVPAAKGAPLGGQWQEDLTCVVPETSCTPNNLTLGFRIDPYTVDERIDGYMRDDGGFAKLDVEPQPYWDNDIPGFRDVGMDPDLSHRSYTAAWWNNQLTAQMLGIESFPDAAGTVYRGNFSGYANLSNPDVLNISNMNGTYLDGLLNITEANADFAQSFYDHGGPFCSGFRNTDQHNTSKVFIRCGNLYSVPTPVNTEGASINTRSDLGSEWNQKIYTCASAVRTLVKTVTFQSNGSSLASLQVLSWDDKDYQNQDLPLWGIEDTRRYMVEDVEPFWGLVGDSFANAVNLSTRRAPSIYLPAANTAATISNEPLDYSAATQIFTVAWNTVYSLAAYFEPTRSGGIPDYSGKDNFAMSLKWRRLSATADGSAKILNLIWTDIVASSVYGTNTGFASNAEQDRSVLGQRSIHRIRHSITYASVPYAIPAMLVVFIAILLAIASLYLFLARHTSWSKVVHYTHQTSMPRVWTQIIHPDKAHHSHSAAHWVKTAGKVLLDIPAHRAPHAVSRNSGGAAYTAAEGADPDEASETVTKRTESSIALRYREVVS